ncbi:hypothetical protein LSM04_008623 [Trypanosoma melophagium]|uniref:uncharacterized protein n=1 Tax=Trypanosoma melophagium TaxID=715481 RepID=UPI00351A9A45|nr:hypothetical protein LSM04_008623 [Trypanosoma melophagium]
MNINNIRKQDAAASPVTLLHQKYGDMKEVEIAKEKSTTQESKEEKDKSFLSTIDHDTNALMVRIKCVERNNRVLTDNVNTLKSVVNQLAAQLDLANNQLALYTGTEELRKLRNCVNQEESHNNKSETSNLSEYNDRIASLHKALRERDAMIMTLRHEMVIQSTNADKLLRAELKEKDKVILRLMEQNEELRRIINAKKNI